MKRASFLFLLFLIAACGRQTDSNGKQVTLSTGEIGTVFLEEQTVDEERVLVIDFRSDRMPARESDVDRLAEEIWAAARTDADSKGFASALIKIRVPMPASESGAARQYNGLLFEAEKIENGTWKLKKVN